MTISLPYIAELPKNLVTNLKRVKTLNLGHHRYKKTIESVKVTSSQVKFHHTKQS